MEFNQAMVFVNESGATLELTIEPWGETYLIKSGDKVQIVGTGGSPGSAFEIHQVDSGIVVFGWVGSVVTVMRDGDVLQPDA